jgi:hypothetical protein
MFLVQGVPDFGIKLNGSAFGGSGMVVQDVELRTSNFRTSNFPPAQPVPRRSESERFQPQPNARAPDRAAEACDELSRERRRERAIFSSLFQQTHSESES